MTTIRIATWNINSIRMRLDQLTRWLELRNFPEIICLQETKVIDQDFPLESFRKLGYEAVIAGQKSYNGVAILSRLPISNVRVSFPYEKLNKEVRIISADIAGTRVINVYVPNGQLPQSDKFIWKFEFLKEFKKYLKDELSENKKIIVCGDFNIAPADIDVWSPNIFRGSTMFTEQEKKVFQEMLDLGFDDIFRLLNPTEQAYSWFDYITMAFDRNHGWRIDFILTTPEISKEVQACKIDCEPRGWEKPSDHCPVVAKLSLD